tara:strand:- start:100 stop:450 length:351 start_codon:yes stop_codon:yes gene_type:complete
MWAQVINICFGLWIIIAPGIFDYNPAAADNGHILGPVIVTFSVVALWEATRVVRKWNYPIAVWLLLGPWILEYSSDIAVASDMISGMLILIFSSFKGEVKNEYGGGWAVLWNNNDP